MARRYRWLWLPGNSARNMPAPRIRRSGTGTLRLNLSKNQSCSFCDEEKRTSSWRFTKLLKMDVRKRRSVYVVGGLSDYWICDCCVKRTMQTLSNPERQPASDAEMRCSFCGNERSAADTIAKGQACICADCLRDIDFAFENPIVPAG